MKIIDIEIEGIKIGTVHTGTEFDSDNTDTLNILIHPKIYEHDYKVTEIHYDGRLFIRLDKEKKT